MSRLIVRCEWCKRTLISGELSEFLTPENDILVDVDLEDLGEHECPDEEFVAPHADPILERARIAQEPPKTTP
jgi:hypothetical protein